MATRDSTPRPTSTIRPRSRAGRCYELAGRLQLDDPTWTLVHGECLMPGGDHHYGHAWLERDGWVHDATLDKSLLWSDYAARFGARRLALFTPHDAAEAAGRCGHWGPWTNGGEG